jgi:colanic acid biosynthesis glycosyl transferase WcaI
MIREWARGVRGRTGRNKMKPQKVCIISKYLLPHDTRLAQQVRALVDHNVGVEVLCLRDEGQARREQQGHLVAHRLMYKKSKEGFVQYLASTAIFGVRSFITLMQRSAKSDFRVIVIHTLPEFLVFIGVLHKIMGKAIILDGRDITYELLSSRWQTSRARLVQQVARVVEWMCMGFCNEVITASNGFKRSLVSRGIAADKIHVLVNTADTAIFKYDANRQPRDIREGARLLYHGTVSERFGVLHAVEAMVTVTRAIPGSTLHVYGYYDRAYHAKIRKTAAALGLESSVVLFEAKQLEEIYRIIGTMDFGVVPYKSDRFMNLALSTKTFEYVAAGLPVAASRLDSVEELFDDDCLFYAEPGNSESLADTIVSMCRRPDACQKKRENAYQTFGRYTGEVVAAQYYGILEKYLPS